MKICFPVAIDSGIDSEVYGHFGSAPAFVIVDRETEGVTAIENSDQSHAHGKCSPIKALGGREIDCVVVGGIGMGALTKLNASGIKVYRAMARTVSENLSLLKSGGLPEFAPGLICRGHSHGGGCAH